MPINLLTEEGFGMIVGSAGESFTGLLDEYPNAAAAYSLRKLRTDYTGNAIEVRRSSDNTTQNIGFTASGDLDTSALTTFVGAGDGFVRTWYDQSGNGNNAIQTTTSNQPKVVNAGSILLRGGKPSIDFGSTVESLSFNITTSSFANSLLNLYTVLSIDQHDAAGTVYFGTTQNGLYWQHGPSTAHYTQGGTQINTEICNDSNQKLLVDYPTSTLKRCDINANTYTSASSTTLTATGSDTFVLGKWEGGVTYDLDGAIQEFIVYTTDQSSNRLGIKSDINTYYSIY